jgi:hypothetical protein
MSGYSPDDTQRHAGRIVGVAYLLALPLAIFAQFYVPNRLAISAKGAAVAQNIMEHERLFRLGLAANIAVSVIDIVLIAALYIVLTPVSRHLAVLATLLRTIETAVLVAAVTINDFDVLRMLGRADYLRSFDVAQLEALARVSLGGHNTGYNVGLFFAGLGSTIFCYLWFESGFVPKGLAVLGVVSSALLAICTLAFVVFPELTKIATVAVYGGPIFVFELSMGAWLLLRRLRPDLAVVEALE